MLKNSKGTILVIQSENNGSMNVQAFKDEATYTSFKTAPTQKNQPQTIGVYVGTKVKDLMASTTSLGSLTLEAKVQQLQEQALLEQIKENPQSLPRFNWEVLTFKQL